ncbi:hypothetical protein QFC22_004778 [Naganishia vaughanmartiniae]|uniref:Uncharacterized protein n=1 Tax=Naganishia vaughanmartiniae TaxID=1424756 RepID=A0ACC2WXV6_9TREE|nr:hypothetical protein QFC22_004778 [Naganishia vaughanmartiniae]
MFPRKPKQLRRASTSAASSFTASRRRTRSASCGPVLSCANTAPFKPIGNSDSVSDSCTKSPDSLCVNLESAIEPESRTALVSISVEVHIDANDAPDTADEENVLVPDLPVPESPVKLVSAATCLVDVQKDGASVDCSVVVESPVPGDESQIAKDKETPLEADGLAPTSPVESVPIRATCSVTLQTGVEDASVSGDDGKLATSQTAEVSPMAHVPAIECSIKPVPTSPVTTYLVDAQDDLQSGGETQTPTPNTMQLMLSADDTDSHNVAESLESVAPTPVSTVLRQRRESAFEEEAMRVLAERRSSTLEREQRALSEDSEAAPTGTSSRLGTLIEPGSDDDLTSRQKAEERVRNRRFWPELVERSIVASPLTSRSVPMEESRRNATSLAYRRTRTTANRKSAHSVRLETNATRARHNASKPLEPVAPAPVDAFVPQQEELICGDGFRAIAVPWPENATDAEMLALLLNPADFSVSGILPEDSGRAGSVLTREKARAEAERRLRDTAEGGGGNGVGNDDIESGGSGAGGL